MTSLWGSANSRESLFYSPSTLIEGHVQWSLIGGGAPSPRPGDGMMYYLQLSMPGAADLSVINSALIERVEIRKDNYLQVLRALGSWDVNKILPVPDDWRPAMSLKPELLGFLSSVVQLGKDLAEDNDEMLSVLYAAEGLAEEFGDRIVGLWPLTDDRGRPVMVEVVMDCDESEWRRVIGVLLRYPRAASVLGVLCERALFHVPSGSS